MIQDLACMLLIFHDLWNSGNRGLDKVSSWLDEKVPANVWFVMPDTVFPCVPLGLALQVIQQPVAPESNKHN